jgi:hypothetical protein
MCSTHLTSLLAESFSPTLFALYFAIINFALLL